MELTLEGLKEKQGWEAAAVALPVYDVEAVHQKTRQTPVWVHFGAGNIFRGYIAGLQDALLNEGKAEQGIIAVETFDYDIIGKIYRPHDNLTLGVTLQADGSMKNRVIASIAEGIRVDEKEQRERLLKLFAVPSLQMASFTITEKGYSLTDMAGKLVATAAGDMEAGPQAFLDGGIRHAMGVVTALLYHRFEHGALPVAMVSMDNCSHNGEKLQTAVLAVAGEWEKRGFVPRAFLDYLNDTSKVTFPWSMIDKITPRPADVVKERLSGSGIAGMEPVITAGKTYIAPFVNAEAAQYLVIEDQFPNGRPPLEEAGVYLTDRDTVNAVERMKVTTCLNPLHTALAVYGCLLGYRLIADEMKDADLVALIRHIGFDEGMKVVTDPGILSPLKFITEVIEERLPNPFIPDMPQRIATDTSQKVPVRFGETIKSYMKDAELSAESLTYIPLALAGWLRYLLAVDDKGEPMEVSSDPMLSSLQAQLAGVTVGVPDSYHGQLKEILANPVLFGSNLYEAGIADKVEGMFVEMIAGNGAVRQTLKKYVG